MDKVFTSSNIIALFAIVATLAVGLAPSELRDFFGIENMTFHKVIIAFLYIIACLMIWVYAINPLIPNENQDFIKQADDYKNQLIFSNMSVNISPDNIVTLRTVINTFSAGLLKPVKSLKPNNFTVEEQLSDEVKNVSVLSVTPLKSASQITILIDASDSMWGETEIAKKGKKLRKIEVVKDSIIKFSTKLIKSQKNSELHSSYLSFMVFSGSGVYSLESSNKDIWFPTKKEYLPEIKKVINSIQPSGETPMFDAISHAIDILGEVNKAEYKLILCLTDGMDNSSNIDPEILQSKIQNNNIPIVTIGYGKEEELDITTLNAISTISGAGKSGIGSFTNIKPKQLTSVFDYALNNINNTYEIKWKSSFPISGKHILARLQAAYQTALGKKISPITELAYTVPSLTK